jgi:hypothetical protein
MARLTFPQLPTVGQEYEAQNGVTYEWTGIAWRVKVSSGGGEGGGPASVVIPEGGTISYEPQQTLRMVNPSGSAIRFFNFGTTCVTFGDSEISPSIVRLHADHLASYNLDGGSYYRFAAKTLNLSPLTVAEVLGQSAYNGTIGYVTDGAPGLAWGDAIVDGGSTSYLVWKHNDVWTVFGK